MDRNEANKIAIWNSIHESIRKRIIEGVKRGNFETTIYKSFMQNEYCYVELDRDKLENLGYIVEFKLIELMDNKIDYAYIISWGVKEF